MNIMLYIFIPTCSNQPILPSSRTGSPSTPEQVSPGAAPPSSRGAQVLLGQDAGCLSGPPADDQPMELWTRGAYPV